ncbi:MAG: VCBS repeat-containing protein [Candidatus Bipolaricaulota bacterium]
MIWRVFSWFTTFVLLYGGSVAGQDVPAPEVWRSTGTTFTESGLLPGYNLYGDPFAAHVDLRAAVGDVNRDGHLDVVLPTIWAFYNQDGESMSFVKTAGRIVVAYGDGTGAFPRIQPVCNTVCVVAVELADLDGDGWLDVVALDTPVDADGQAIGPAVVRILWGSETGAFSEQSELSAPTSAMSVLAGDVTHDARLDLVLVALDEDTGCQEFRVLVGEGGRQFRDGPTTPTDRGVVVGALCAWLHDMDGDGWLDVVAVGSTSIYTPTSVCIAYGKAGGAFNVVWDPWDDGRSPRDVALADLNGDGRTDIAIAYPLDFDTPIEAFFATGEMSQASVANEGRIRVLRNAGARTFERAEWRAATVARTLIGCELDGNPGDELLVFGRSGSVSVLTGSAALAPGTGSIYLCPVGPVVPFVGDFNGDGHLDVGAQGTARDLAVIAGDGRGGLGAGWLSPPFDSATTCGNRVAEETADFDHDGHQDLVYYGDMCGVGVAYGDGTGRFADGGLLFDSEHWVEDVAVGDFNGDGEPDILIAAETGQRGMWGAIWLYAGTGTRAFVADDEPALPTVEFLRLLLPANIDGDACQDVIVASSLSGAFASFGAADGKLVPAAAFEAPRAEPGSPPWELDGFRQARVADFTHDGVPDVVAVISLDKDAEGYNRTEAVAVWVGSRDGEYTFAWGFAEGDLYFSGVGDVNGDGHLDFLVDDLSTGKAHLALGDGTGHFERTDSDHLFELSADMNGDGVLDAVGTFFGHVSVALGPLLEPDNPRAQFIDTARVLRASFVRLGCLADVNADGWLDVINVDEKLVSVLLNRFGDAR